MRLRRIHIESYRLFKIFDIQFNNPKYKYFGNLNISVLVGENGTGKTTLLKAISDKFCPSSFNNSIDENSVIEIEYEIEKRVIKNFQCGDEQVPKKLITSSFAVFDQHSPIPRWIKKRKRGQENVKVDRTEYVYCGPIERNYSNTELIVKYVLNIISSGDRRKLDKCFKIIQKVGFIGFTYIELDYYVLKNTMKNLKKDWKPNYYGRRSHYDDLMEEDYEDMKNYAERVIKIKKYANRKKGRLLVPIEVFMKELYFGYKKATELDLNSGVKDIHFINSNDNDVSLAKLSSGEITMLFRFIPLIAEVEDNSIIIIDEPETHLHPKWAQEFIDYLVQLFGEYKVHFILATHSPTIISDVPRECIIGLQKNGDMIIQYEPKDRTLGLTPTELLRDVFRIKEISSKYAIYMRNYLDELLKKESISKEELSVALRIYNDLGTNLEKYELFKKHKKILEKGYVEE